MCTLENVSRFVCFIDLFGYVGICAFSWEYFATALRLSPDISHLGGASATGNRLICLGFPADFFGVLVGYCNLLADDFDSGGVLTKAGKVHSSAMMSS